AHLLDGIVPARDADDVVAAAVPLERELVALVHEQRGLAAQKRDEGVGGYRDVRQARDVAGARRALKELLFARVEQRELRAVGGQRRDDRLDGWRAEHVEAE